MIPNWMKTSHTKKITDKKRTKTRRRYLPKSAKIAGNMKIAPTETHVSHIFGPPVERHIPGNCSSDYHKHSQSEFILRGWGLFREGCYGRACVRRCYRWGPRDFWISRVIRKIEVTRTHGGCWWRLERVCQLQEAKSSAAMILHEQEYRSFV